MGDRRFDRSRERIATSQDRRAALDASADDEIIQALAASARDHDPYLANVLATEALNRLANTTTIVEHSAQAFITLDAQGAVRRSNPATSRILGWAANDLVGRAFDSIIIIRDAKGRATRLAGGRSPGGGSGYTVIRRDGVEVPIDWFTAAVRKDGEVTGYIVTISDVSARVAAERHVERQTRLYQSLIDAQTRLGHGIAVTDGASVRFANEAFARLAGRALVDVLRSEDLSQLVAPPDRERFREILGTVASHARATRFDMVLVRPDGSTAAVEAALQPIGGTADMVLLLRDVGTRRAVTTAMRESERTFRAIFESAPVALGWCTRDGAWLRANDAMCDIVQQDVLTLCRQGWGGFLSAEDRARVDDAFRALASPAKDVVDLDISVDDQVMKLTLTVGIEGQGCVVALTPRPGRDISTRALASSCLDQEMGSARRSSCEH